MNIKQILVGKILCIMLLPIMVIGSEKNQPTKSNASISVDWESKILAQIQKDEYNPSLQTLDVKGEPLTQQRYHFANRTENLRAYLDINGVELMPRIMGEKDNWNLKYHMNSIYRKGGDIKSYDRVEPKISNNKIIYQFQGLTLEYANSEEGIEHNIIIQEPPEGEGKLFIKENIETQNLLLTQNAGDCVIFFHNKEKIFYRIQKVEDAEKRDINSSMRYDGDTQFTISVDDTSATYPICISLLVSSNKKQPKSRFNNDVSGLSEIPNWTVQSNQEYAHFGVSVSQAGDVNGDGYSDIIIGAPCYDNGQDDEGRVYVYCGSALGLSLIADWTLEPDQAEAYLGWSVSTAGDVNGDGYSDIIIGAPGYHKYDGRAFVYHGGDSGLSQTAGWTTGSNQAKEYFGVSVSQAGDVNGDGYSDVIVGADMYDNGQVNEGRAYVYHGSASGLSQNATWTAESDQEYAYFGTSVSTAGDVNGDGYSDVIVGADMFSDSVTTNEGRAYIYYGSASGLSVDADWTAESDQEYAYFGVSVSTAGDVNGDGYSDVIVGVHYYDNRQANEGRAFVYSGSALGLSPTPDWVAESNQAYAHFGVSVSTAGDVNGDGYSDIIVGAYGYNNFQSNEGRVFMFYGSKRGLSTQVDWSAESNQAGAYFGISVSTAGDVNGDGYSDVIIGAYRYDIGHIDEGCVFVYYGNVSR